MTKNRIARFWSFFVRHKTSVGELSILAVVMAAATYFAYHFDVFANENLATVHEQRIELDEVSMLSGILAAGLLIIAVRRYFEQQRETRRRIEAENFARAQARRFASLLEGVRDYAIVMLDTRGRVTKWNTGAEQITGYEAAEAVGRPYTEVLAMDERADGDYSKCIATALRDGRYEAELSGLRKDGGRYCGHCIVTPVLDEADDVLGFAYVTQDITHRKADERRILEVSRNLDAALNHMSHGLCVYDADERLVLANDRFRQMYDYDSQELQPGITFRELTIHALRRRDGAEPDKATIDHIHFRHRKLIAQADGGGMISSDFAGKIVAISHRAMPGGGWVSTFEDVSERHRNEARIAHMARHDELTGLPNRTEFGGRLEEMLGLAARSAHQVCVVAIDLDGFKGVNDEHGHTVGDEVLKVLATRMGASLRDDEIVARCGGDEFEAAKRYAQPAELDDFVARLKASLSAPLHIGSLPIAVQASIGVARYPDDGLLREVLLNNADIALNRAKTTIGDKIGYYEADIGEAARERRFLAHDLVRALRDGEFRVFYQKQVLVTTGEITGYEALIRWKHPVRGFVSPLDFIGAAEESGAILDIGAWVLRTACEEAATWNGDLKIAVNLSPVQLNDIHLIDIVRQVLIDTGLKPGRLELEITESLLIDDKLRALHILRQIKSLGVAIAMDDFGTGYASLDTLNSFPFDKIKIDQSFLRDAETSGQARAIIRSIIALGRSLQVPILAEGVETNEQWRLLREEGCEEAQGYLFGRPEETILTTKGQNFG